MKNKMYAMLLAICMLCILQGCTAGNVNIIADSVTVSTPETTDLAVEEPDPAREEPDPVREELDQFAARLLEEKDQNMGYPVNQEMQLSGFYDWLSESGFDSLMANNAGDPFDDGTHYHLNAMSFEREVIEFFGPHYGFDPDDLAQSIRGQ